MTANDALWLTYFVIGVLLAAVTAASMARSSRSSGGGIWLIVVALPVIWPLLGLAALAELWEWAWLGRKNGVRR